MNNKKFNLRRLVVSLLSLSICIAVCFFSFTACGNQAVLDPGAFSFTHIHISDAVEGHCFEVKKWWDSESGIEVRFTSGEGIYCSEGTYQMFTSQAACPYCNED